MSRELEGGTSADADDTVSRWSALRSVLANWRDWNLPVKLAAVTMVPIVFAIVLGTMQISDQVDRASDYRRVDRLVVVNQELRVLVGALQNERGAAGVLLANRAADTVAQLADEQRATNTARDMFLRAAGRVTLDDEIVAARYAEVLRWLDELVEIRRQVAGTTFDATGTVARYTDVVDSLLRFDRTMAAEAMDPQLASTSSALYDLEAIKEQVRFQHALVAVGLVADGVSGPDRAALEVSQRRLLDRVDDFYAVANAGRRQLYDATVRGDTVMSRDTVVDTVVANAAGEPIPVAATAWRDISTDTADRIARVADVLATDLRDRSAALQDEASDAAGLAAVLLLVALVVAIGVMFVVGRHLVSSLSALRRSALDVAERALPDAVSRIMDKGEDAASIELAPVPVRSMDEVGQVARAFDAVQRQALRLATEQAGLRAKYSSVFVNLSRRSQGLVQRQLHLLERLERDEEDADQLATLFQLDHLATRMRRNNENLMVLSGSEIGRRNQRPTSLADLLRASVSEIEQYQRVVLLPPPNVRVVGYAAGDLVRLVAELLDNATAFSAPDTQVTIASHSFEDRSLCVAVLDEGIGMSQAELDEANAKLADAGSIDVSSSRRMGLFVIGRLAVRHGIEVRLGGGEDVTGVRATVTVPPDLVLPTEAGAQERSRPAGGPGTLRPFAVGGASRRNGHTNGTAGNGVNGHTNGVNGHRRTTPSPFPRRADEPDAARDEPVEPPVSEDLGEATAEDRMPLPRRSPGSRMPGPRAGAPAPDDLARPRDPFQPPEDGLFTPAEENDPGASWWTSGTPADRSALEETTPIFDEMVSAWFRAVSDPEVDDETAAAMRPEDGEDAGEDAWRFAADSGFRAAQAVSRAKPADFTANGLPRRSPSQNLVPGSAASEAAPEPPRHARDADHVRQKLSSYRHGVRRARDHRQSVEAAGARQEPPAVTQQTTGEPSFFEPEQVTADPAGAGGLSFFQPEPATVEPPRAEGPEPVIGDPAGVGGASFFRPESATADPEPATAEPPRAGETSVFRPESATADPAAADPAGVGGASFFQPTPATAEPGILWEPSFFGPAPADAVLRSGATGGPATDANRLDLSGAGWRFAADLGWRAATQASDHIPVDFTSGGLPRRSPRQHLLPGSIAHTGNGNGGGPSRLDRAEEMRGRLGSFQRGLSRGRRSLADRTSAPGFHDHEQQQESE